MCAVALTSCGTGSCVALSVSQRAWARQQLTVASMPRARTPSVLMYQLKECRTRNEAARTAAQTAMASTYIPNESHCHRFHGLFETLSSACESSFGAPWLSSSCRRRLAGEYLRHTNKSAAHHRQRSCTHSGNAETHQIGQLSSGDSARGALSQSELRACIHVSMSDPRRQTPSFTSRSIS